MTSAAFASYPLPRYSGGSERIRGLPANGLGRGLFSHASIDAAENQYPHPSPPPEYRGRGKRRPRNFCHAPEDEDDKVTLF